MQQQQQQPYQQLPQADAYDYNKPRPILEPGEPQQQVIVVHDSQSKDLCLYICLGCLIFWVVFIVLVVVLVIVYEVTDDDGRAR